MDDTTLVSTTDTIEVDADDYLAIVQRLIKRKAINWDKTQGPATVLEVIGWQCDMDRAIVSPSLKGFGKLFHYAFNVVSAQNRRVRTDTLRRMIATFRWYARTLPLCMGAMFALTDVLTAADRSKKPVVSLTAMALDELSLWKKTLLAIIGNKELGAIPFDFLARLAPGTAPLNVLYTDASTGFGGGYAVQTPGVKSFAKFEWESKDREVSRETVSINVLELAAMVLAVERNLRVLMNMSVTVYVDNTAAESWVKVFQAKSPVARPWIRYLLLICLSFNIRIMPVHVPSLENTIADALSRGSQAMVDQLLQNGFTQQEVMDGPTRGEIWTMSCGNSALAEQWKSLLAILIRRESELSGSSASSRTSIHSLLQIL